jgi:hypothetical protein
MFQSSRAKDGLDCSLSVTILLCWNLVDSCLLDPLNVFLQAYTVISYLGCISNINRKICSGSRAKDGLDCCISVTKLLCWNLVDSCLLDPLNVFLQAYTVISYLGSISNINRKICSGFYFFFVMQAWLATISLALCKVSLLWREMLHKANGVLFLHLSNYCAYTCNI